MTDRFVERETCPSCASPVARTLYRSAFDQEPLASYLSVYYRRPAPRGIYQLDKCLTCELVFQRFVGNDKLLAALYSEWLTQAPQDQPNYAADLRHFRQSRDGHELMTLAAFLKRPRLKVLDYGTGWGLRSAIARKLGHAAYATEVADEKAKWVREQGVEIVSDGELRSHRFDVINLEQTLEHVTDPRALLQSLVPSLAGVLKIAVPNASRADRIVRQLERGDCSGIGPLHPLEHINGFSPVSLSRLAASLGLQEVRPSLMQRYVFIRTGIPTTPKRLAKELARPFWSFRSRTNLYRWFVRAT